MKENSERLLRQNTHPRLDVPRQPQSWMNIDNTNKPGIGLLGKGEENDYDVYDTEFHGGKKGTKRSRKTKQTRKTKRSKKAKKKNKTRKTRKNTKRPRK
jgi:hypothetical protein